MSHAHQNVQCTYLSFMSSASDHAHTESAKIMYTHTRKWKTCINIAVPELFRRDLWPHYIALQLQEVLKVVVATG